VFFQLTGRRQAEEPTDADDATQEAVA